MRPYRRTTATLLVAVVCLGVATAVWHAATPESTGLAGVRSTPGQIGAGALAGRIATPTPRASAGASAVPPTTERLIKGRVIVRLKGPATPSALRRLARSAGTSVAAASVLHGNTLLWRVPVGVSEEEFGRRLEESDDVAYAELDYNRQLAAVYTPPAYTPPNEVAFLEIGGKPQFPYWRSWWLRDIKAPQMWEQAYTGPTVLGKYPLRGSGTEFKVAVLDTGLWPDHPDAGNIVPGWDCYSKDGDVTPPNPDSLLRVRTDERIKTASHGTNVAGLIGATVGNGVGSFGSGYDTQVVVYKIAGVSPVGELMIPDSVIISAIERAVDDGCKIINMSFAGAEDSLAMRDAIDYAHSKGCILVAAGGNKNSAPLEYPAGWPNVVGVGALTKSISGSSVARAWFSNYGTGLDLSAPGDEIWGLTHPSYGEGNSGYDWWRGTSMASPIVAGGLAVLWRAVPQMSGDEIVSVAQSSATDLYTTGWDKDSGWGELNLAAAYDKLTTTYPLLTTPTISVPTTPSVKAIPITWSAVPGYRGRYDVTLDGSLVGAGIATTGTVLPAVSPGAHTITVTPTSSRNWADSTEVGVKSVSAFESLPVMTDLSSDGVRLSWKSTESAETGGGYLFALDGGSVVPTSSVAYDASALPLGMHSATVWAVDPDGLQSEPLSIVFRRWPKPVVTRASGADRYATNAALATSTFASANTAVLVSGENWPDALAAGPLATGLGGPVLLTARNTLPSSTRAALLRLGVTNVVVVGGASSVSDGVVKSLRSSGLTVSRVWGRDRYATAHAVAREVWRMNGGPVPDGTALIASGATPQDALIASTLGARKGWPVRLTPSTKLPNGLKTTLRTIGATRTVVIGSSKAVSSATLASLPTATRITGVAAPSTSVAVATWARATYPDEFLGERYWVASSSAGSFADSLGIGAAAGHTSGLLLLTPTTLAPSVTAYYSANSADAAVNTVVGGPAALPTTLLTTIKRLVGAP